jgi:pyruvate/2-oxoacid:ferredoxin oxidoreductase alpha subunit
MKKLLLGSHAVAHGARLSMVDVIAAYPITPQTSIVEKLAEFCSDGSLNARFVNVESEHSAMAACIGASSAGARAFTATSSQGLALMHELLHWAAGARLPIVLANANRALAAPWSIGTDHTDSLSQRDTGWLQFYCENCQECLDTTIQAFKIAETVSLPVMINLDGFVLTHISEPVDIPELDRVTAYLPPFNPEFKLDVEEPRAFGGGMIGPHARYYMDFRSKMQDSMEQAKTAAQQADEEFREVFARRYGVVDEYHCDHADLVIISAGTIAGTVRAVAKNLRGSHIKVGALKVRMFRPFPSEKVREILQSAKKVAVIDRDLSPGLGGIFTQEVRSCLYRLRSRPQVFGFLTGLGGNDVSPEVVSEIIDYALNHDEPAKDYVWIGLLK